MRIATMLICLFLGLTMPQLSIAGKKEGGGGGKGAHAGGGGGRGGGGGHGGGGGRAAHMGGGGGGGNHGMNAGNHGGGGQHAARNLQGGGQGGKGGHGLNSHHQAANGGLNNHHQGANGGQIGRRNGTLHGGNNFARHTGNNRFAAHNGHWRASHWRSSHDVFYSYHRVWHDHVWWGSHYDVITFGGGWGPWYWDAGYWYPAWGYAPGFVYGFDRPIYSYANLPPDQVVVNVQEALQDQGYYRGEIDGQLGQLTRDAIQQYQQDHMLEVTAAIDEPTVQALGLATQES